MKVAPSSVDVLGLDGTFPRPGWIVLDAARDVAFTGEIELESTPPVRVYCDRGRIYLAERTTDPPLGARLVDAGALDAVQLDHGTIRIGDVDHLGRLFERSPSVDRQTVMVVLEMMTEEATTWVAGQSVRGAHVTPYRHHPTGVHRWERYRSVVLDILPGSPLPAPDPTDLATPAPPPPISKVFGPVDDELDSDIRIVWDEPTFVDGRPTWTTPSTPAAGGGTAETEASGAGTDEARESAAAGGAAGDSLGGDATGGQRAWDEPTATIPPDPMTFDVLVASDALEGFEVIWPSGEVDDEFGDSGVPTMAGGVRAPSGTDMREGGADAPGDAPSGEPAGRAPLQPGEIRFSMPVPTRTAAEVERAEAERAEPVSDEVVLAVRRAIAAIETGFATGAWPADMGVATAAPADDDELPALPVRGAAATDVVAGDAMAADTMIAGGQRPYVDRLRDQRHREAPDVPLSNGSGRTTIVPSAGSGRPAEPVPGVLEGYDESPPAQEWRTDESGAMGVGGSGWTPPSTPPPPPGHEYLAGPREPVTAERKSALRRLIDGLRRR